MSKNYLYIPMEIYSRELNGMLILSIIAAKNGWTVVLTGKKHFFPIVDILPKGICLVKSIVPGEIHIQDKIRKPRHKIITLDAEGLIPSTGESGVTLRYCAESIEKTEKLFFWGKDQFMQTKKVFPQIEEKSFITGSPVFDYFKLLKAKIINKSNEKKKEILIATSFPFPNHKLGPNHAREMTKNCSGESATKEHLDEIFLDADLQDIVYPKFKEMVSQLAVSIPDCKIKLRPHPTENIEPWKKIADQNDNVELQFEGEITQHIINCDIFIHFNSTTSIEACFYDKKVITFVPELEEKLYKRLSPHVLSVSNIYNNIENLINAVKDSLEKQISINDKTTISLIVNGGDNEDCLHASKKIIDSIEDLKTSEDKGSFPKKHRLNYSKEKSITQLKNFTLCCFGWMDHYSNIFSGKYAWAKDFYKAARAKQGRLEDEEIRNKINDILEISGIDKNEINITKAYEFYIFESNKKEGKV